MTRREALKRTPAESREVPLMLNEDVQNPNEEAAPSIWSVPRIVNSRSTRVGGKVIEELVILLQAQQINPVLYHPQMIGLVERFYRAWKDCVATCMHEEAQRDWDVWVDFVVYAHNSGWHSTVQLSPNELLMGRRPRSPNELLRNMNVHEAGKLTAYHQRLLTAMSSSRKCADVARAQEQERQARYYNRKVRNPHTIRSRDRVLMFRPPRGPTAPKFVHQLLGPMRVVEPAGFDNFLVEREDVDGQPECYIAHVSFLVIYHRPASTLQRIAVDIKAQLNHEDADGRHSDGAAPTKIIGTTTAPVQTAVTAISGEQRRRTVVSPAERWESHELLVELRQRRRRNITGQYVLEYELRLEILSNEYENDQELGSESDDNNSLDDPASCLTRDNFEESMSQPPGPQNWMLEGEWPKIAEERGARGSNRLKVLGSSSDTDKAHQTRRCPTRMRPISGWCFPSRHSSVPSHDQAAYQLAIPKDRFGYSSDQDVNPSDEPQDGLPVCILRPPGTRTKSNPCTHGIFGQCSKPQELPKSGMSSTKTQVQATTSVHYGVRSHDVSTVQTDPKIQMLPRSSMMSVRLPSVQRGASVYKSQVTPKRRTCFEQRRPLKIQIPRKIEETKRLDSQSEITLSKVCSAF
ncbi:unnamed protein product [Phytophthora fragariaefolia]|uniref:Unnamed protein product n=1 Tax=Phytophthora fragariaefolia TaxID=1490495 RepID=A0A9W6TI89_9STRA|nr:unnamed protein product [Phytophthora fragariaefolia]